MECKVQKCKSKKIGDIFSHVTIGTNVTKDFSMIRPASSNGYINHWNKTKRKSKKKIGDILSHVTIGTNVTKGVTPIRIHHYSCYIVLDTEMQAFSLKLPLLHLFRSLHGKRCPQFFGTFLFRYVSVYTPIRIHGYSCYILLDTEMQALSLKLPLLHLFLLLHVKKDVPNFTLTNVLKNF